MRALIVFSATDKGTKENQELFRFSEELHYLHTSNIAVLPSRLGQADELTQFVHRKVRSGQLRGRLNWLFVALIGVLHRVDFIACSDAGLASGLRRLTSCPVIDVSERRRGVTLEERISAAAVVVNQAVVWKIQHRQ